MTPTETVPLFVVTTHTSCERAQPINHEMRHIAQVPRTLSVPAAIGASGCAARALHSSSSVTIGTSCSLTAISCALPCLHASVALAPQRNSSEMIDACHVVDVNDHSHEAHRTKRTWFDMTA